MPKKLFLILLFLTLSSCVTVPERQRFFWPPLPDVPKIEYMGAYQSRADFPELTEWEVVWDSLFGEDASRLFIKPWGIASNGKGKVYVTDAPMGSIVIFDLIKRKVKIVREVEFPYGIAIDGEGMLYVSSRKYHAIMVFDGDGRPIRSFGERELKGPAGIGINKELGLLYCTDVVDHSIKVFNLEGGFLYAFGERGSAEGSFNYPTDVDVGSHGQVVVADSMNARIQIFDREGKFIRSFGRRGVGTSGFQIIKGVAVDSDDHIYVTDAMGSHFKIFSMEGKLLLLLGGPSAVRVPGGFNLPMDIDIDDKDGIYIVDQHNFAFQIYQYLSEEYLQKNPVR